MCYEVTDGLTESQEIEGIDKRIEMQGMTGIRAAEARFIANTMVPIPSKTTSQIPASHGR